jgi:hypothetical protein
MLIAPAAHVAARTRLNTERGFNPLKFGRAVRDLLSQLDGVRRAPKRRSA